MRGADQTESHQIKVQMETKCAGCGKDLKLHDDAVWERKQGARPSRILCLPCAEPPKVN